MPDDFQAQPPRPPDGAELPLSPYDRFAQVNLRKPESEGYDWRGVKFVAVFVFVGLGLLALLAIGLRTVDGRARGTFIYVGNPKPPLPLPPPAAAPWDGVDEEKELQALDGTWSATFANIDGEVADDDDLPKFKLTLLNQTRRFRMQLRDRKYAGDYQVTLLDFKRIDLKDDMPLRRDLGAGFNVRGIYVLDGDTLIICFTENERPADFSSPKGSGRTLLVLKRQE
jgi:uncharacterized protein (TIGR03067 family)